MRWIPIPELLIATGASVLSLTMADVAPGYSAHEILIWALLGLVCLVGGIRLRWHPPWA